MKGFELSANILVVIILGIVLFGAGLFIFGKIVTTGQHVQNDVDARTQEQLERAMDDGSLVVVPINRVTVARGESARFAFGFYNSYSTQESFTISVTVPSGWNTANFVSNYNDIKANEKVSGLISIQVPKTASTGQNPITIEVKHGSSTYGSKQRVYVVVK